MSPRPSISFLRKLPKAPRWFLNKLGANLDSLLLKIASSNRLASSFYYTFFNTGFSYEQRAFAAGRLTYNRSIKTPTGTRALLRRNVHRLEKGLLMRPRRVPFGVGFIWETVNAYVSATSTAAEDPNELQWATDVLRQYFEVNDFNIPEILKAKEAFTRTPNLGKSRRQMIPYLRDIEKPPSVTNSNLLELAKRRRSVRWFLQKQVPRDIIDQAVEVAGLAPSACNRQPYKFLIFDDQILAQKIMKIPFGMAGYEHNVPCVMVLLGKQGNFFDERDRHLIYIDGSLATMGLLLSLETQGVSSCCVNWPEIASNDIKMAKLLNLEPDERPIMLIAIGYPDPDGMVARSTKKSLDSIRQYNFE